MADKRYRCTACGNLTRFDVTISRQTKAFWHYTLGGELRVEDEEVLAEVVEGRTCRWCEGPTEITEEDAPVAQDSEATTE